MPDDSLVIAGGITDLQHQDRVARRLRSGLERTATGTRRAYNFALTKFSAFAAAALGVSMTPRWWITIQLVASHGRVVTADLVDRFATEACAGLAPATIAQRQAAIRWALNLLYDAGIIAWTVRVKSPKITSYRDTAGPGLDAICALLAAADAVSGVRGLRDAAVVRALFILGLRRGEITSLSVGDWRADRRMLSVLGKGRVDRQLVSVPLNLAARIDAYVAARGPLAETEPLFATHGPRSKDRALRGDAIRRILLRLSKAAGLAKSVRPHGLRHAAITNALDLFNGDPRRVARFSRHRKIETVVGYDDRRRDLAGEVAEGLEGLLLDSVQPPEVPSQDV